MTKKTENLDFTVPSAAPMQLKAKEEPVKTTSLTLCDLVKKGEAVTHEDLANFLATIDAFHAVFGRVPAEYQGERNIPVPAEFVDVAGEKLFKYRDAWQEKKQAARTSTIDGRNEKIRRQADINRQGVIGGNDSRNASQIRHNPKMREVIRQADGTLLSLRQLRKIIKE